MLLGWFKNLHHVCPELSVNNDKALQEIIYLSEKLSSREHSLLLWMVDQYTRAFVTDFIHGKNLTLIQWSNKLLKPVKQFGQNKLHNTLIHAIGSFFKRMNKKIELQFIPYVMVQNIHEMATDIIQFLDFVRHAFANKQDQAFQVDKCSLPAQVCLYH